MHIQLDMQELDRVVDQLMWMEKMQFKVLDLVVEVVVTVLLLVVVVVRVL